MRLSLSCSIATSGSAPGLRIAAFFRNPSTTVSDFARTLGMWRMSTSTYPDISNKVRSVGGTVEPARPPHRHDRGRAPPCRRMQESREPARRAAGTKADRGIWNGIPRPFSLRQVRQIVEHGHEADLTLPVAPGHVPVHFFQCNKYSSISGVAATPNNRRLPLRFHDAVAPSRPDRHEIGHRLFGTSGPPSCVPSAVRD